jgi:regulator of sirC expression with transglutaminase-like and TPR domain
MESITYLGLLDDEAIALDVAALELSALDHPGIDLQPYQDMLEAIAERVAELGAEAETGAEQAAVLAHVLAREYGFAGDRTGYDAPVNADLVRVIDRRRGLPVSLAILYVGAAARVGWDAAALNVPGHVLVSVGDEAGAVLVDAFGGGTIVSPDRLAALLAGVLGPGAFPAAEHLQPMTNRQVLVRLLLNQASRAEQGGDASRAAALFRRMTVIAPENGQGWWDLARMQLGARDIDAARGSLSAMLEVTRDRERRDQIAAALEALAGR